MAKKILGISQHATINSTPITPDLGFTKMYAKTALASPFTRWYWMDDAGNEYEVGTPYSPSGTTNFVTKFTSSSDIGNSQIFDDGTSVGVNISTSLGAKLHVKGAGNTSGTTAFRVDSSTVANIFVVRDDSAVFFKNNVIINPTAGTDMAIGLMSNNKPRFVFSNAFDDRSFLNIYNPGGSDAFTFGMESTDRIGFFSTSRNEWDYILERNTGNSRFGLNTTNASARVHIKGAGNTSGTTAFRVDSSTVDNNFWVRDDGVVNFKNELWRDGSRFLYANPNSTTNNLFLGYSSGNTTLTGNNNIGVGYGTLLSNATGYENVAIGTSSLEKNTIGYYNVAIGQNSLFNNIGGTYNTSIGYRSLFLNVNGIANTAIGTGTLFSNISDNNTAIGYAALYSNTNGTRNVGIGTAALYNNTTGSFNIAIAAAGALYNNTTGVENIAIGLNSLQNVTTGGYNIGIGTNSGQNLVGTFFNTAIGYNALNSNAGNYNIAIGYEAAKDFTGSNVIAIGDRALQKNTNGTLNIAIGALALNNTTTGGANTAIGNYSLISNTTGYENTAIGYNSLYTTTGSENVAIGAYSLRNLTTGNRNVGVGAYSGANATGSDNVFIGWDAGFNTNNASASILIGHNANFTNSTYTSAIAIGRSAAVRESNIMVVGSDITLINKAFFGRGQVSVGTGSFSLSIHGKPGSNINDVTPLTDESAAANIFFIDGSRGTGTGRGGNVIFRTANAGSTGNSQNTLTEVLKVTDTQRVFIKTPLTAPADGDFIDHGVVNTPQFTTYLDEPNNFLYFKVKYSDGSFKEGRISLS